MAALGLGGLFDSKRIDAPGVETLDPLRPEYQGLSSDLASYGRSLLGKTSTPYTGALSAPIGGGEQNILDIINKMVIPGGDGSSAPLGLSSPSLPTTSLAFGDQRSKLISDILSGSRLSPDSNPYLASNIDYLRNESGKTLGANANLLDAVFGRSGITGRGTGRSVQATDLAQKSAMDTNSLIAQVLGQNYNNGLNEQMNVLSSILPGIDAFNQQGVDNAQRNILNSQQDRSLNLADRSAADAERTNKINMLFSALGANALPRQIQQAGLSNSYQEFLRMLGEPNQNATLASSILSNSPRFQFNTPAAPQYAPSDLSQILGAFAQIGQTALPFALA